MKTTTRTLMICGLAIGSLTAGYLAGHAKAASEKKDRIFELRTYTTAEGRLDNLHARFRDHTNKIFVRHGMELVGYWTPTDKDKAKNTLVYILAHTDRAASKKSWKAFGSDPAWKKAHKESTADGPIVTKVESQFLNPTDYSPIR